MGHSVDSPHTTQGPNWSHFFSPHSLLNLNSSSNVFHFDYSSSIYKSCLYSFKCVNPHTFLWFVRSGTLPWRDWAYEVAKRWDWGPRGIFLPSGFFWQSHKKGWAMLSFLELLWALPCIPLVLKPTAMYLECKESAREGRDGGYQARSCSCRWHWSCFLAPTEHVEHGHHYVKPPLIQFESLAGSPTCLWCLLSLLQMLLTWEILLLAISSLLRLGLFHCQSCGSELMRSYGLLAIPCHLC